VQKIEKKKTPIGSKIRWAPAGREKRALSLPLKKEVENTSKKKFINKRPRRGSSKNQKVQKKPQKKETVFET